MTAADGAVHYHLDMIMMFHPQEDPKGWCDGSSVFTLAPGEFPKCTKHDLPVRVVESVKPLHVLPEFVKFDWIGRVVHFQAEGHSRFVALCDAAL